MPLASERRRDFLLTGFKWAALIAWGSLVYPLLRFTGYTVKAKPRHLLISRVVPVRGYHLADDFILFNQPDGPLAVSRVCTHLGCRLNFRAELDLLECPCHQSRFTRQGQRIAGPAKDDLPLYPVEIQKDQAGMVTGYLVTL